MADLCTNLPIYRVTKGRLSQDDTKELGDEEEEANVAEMPAEGEEKNELHRLEMCELLFGGKNHSGMANWN